LVVDGNFKAEQIKMRKPDDDVALIDGEGYMVTDRPYREHLRVAIETKEVMFVHCWHSSANIYLPEIELYKS
jgi:hypothetical protein